MAGGKLSAGAGMPVALPPGDSTGTLAFRASSPKAEGLTCAMPATPARVIEAVRDRISKCRVRLSESGIATMLNSDGELVYKNLAPNLRGAWMLQMPGCGGRGEDLKFLVGRTRSTLFLLYDFSPESIYENTAFMCVNFRARDILELAGGKTMFLSRVTREDVVALNAMAASAGGKAGASGNSSLAPDREPVVGTADLAARLRGATDVRSGDLLFDINAFAEGIVFSTALQDLSGEPYHYIVSGSEEHGFRLYVNRDPGAPDGALFRTTLSVNGEKCVLYQEG